MKATRLTLRQFTVFENATFEFAPGVNVFIGENGTGKSHVLKLVYALTEAARRFAAGQGLEGGVAATLEHLVRGMLLGVFQPDGLDSFGTTDSAPATVALDFEGARLEVELGPGDELTVRADGAFTQVGRPLFIPPREVLSIFPGFVAAWLNRESAFDRTYFDLCVALELKVLRAGGRAALLKTLLKPIEEELGGRVMLKNGRFYVVYPGGDMEIPMVAEGDRKLAMIAYLLMNGSIYERVCLLWDEPEANLNPKRARLMSDTAVGLARAGGQVFLATHDYVLTSDLALNAEADVGTPPLFAFFSLVRPRDRSGVVVERGRQLADLQDNAILDAFAVLHERERKAFQGDTGADAEVR
ncbi:MAG TPA: AAA family ATPase [Polyangiaceae bacterium]|nr:AAA family ATPase [Polyangiaceae bacterium]